MTRQRTSRSGVALALGLLVATVPLGLLGAGEADAAYLAATMDDLVFIHHSCGSGWLGAGLHDALLAMEYIDERNDITYGTIVAADAGRPGSLDPTPGNSTNMNHWILWFNDYLAGVKAHGAATGFNRIIMFKSCYPISNVAGDGTEPGDPFSGSQTLANYRAVYRHPEGSGNAYVHPSNGYAYKPLEDVFAENPDVLFIPVTAPPRHYAPSDATNDAEAQRAREFNDWLKSDWLPGYNAAHPGLNNVAVFDWFDVLAYACDHADHPNRLRAEYGGAGGDSHPNGMANVDSTAMFASNPDNFIDAAWAAFIGTGGSLDASTKIADATRPAYGDTLTYTIRLVNPGSTLSGVLVTDTLPVGVSSRENLWASSGSFGEAGGVITWTGPVASGVPVTLTYAVSVTISSPQVISNTAWIDDGQGAVLQRRAMVIANAYTAYCSLVAKGD